MNKLLNKISAIAFVAIAIVSFTSCVKKEFDSPPDPAGIDPNIQVTTTIAELKAMDTLAGVPIRIVDDLVISGIIVADDKSGNFYKEMVVQDATGGISIQVDQSNYYTDYPVGRRVFIKLRDLYLGEYNKLIQLGGYYTTSGTYFNIERIPQTLISQHILKGSYYHPVTPKTISIFNISKNPYLYQNTLVKVTDLEFTSAYSNIPWSNGPNFSDINMDLEDCCGNGLVIRNSDYATYGYTLTPAGKGTMTGIFQVYGTDNQIKIRDLGDVSMNGPRCGSGVSLPIGTGALMDLKDIRDLFTGCSAGFKLGTKIRGTVTSDLTTGNINSYNLVLQDATAGIVVRFYSPNSFNLKDSIEIDLGGDSLTSFGGLVQISSVDITDVTIKGTGTIVPRVATTLEIIEHKDQWESTLLKLNDVTLSMGTAGTYSGTVVMTDAFGALDLYTRSGATFSGTAYPTGLHSVTGYLNQFNGSPEINIRSTTDVQ